MTQDKPTTLEQLSDQSILERIKTIIPPADDIARTLQVEHAAAERIRRMMVITHAALIELSEEANQIAVSAVEASEQATQVSDQRANMTAMEKFADKQADAQQIAQTQDVLFSKDDVSIRHVLEIVDLMELTRAARPMKRHRVAEIIDALLKAVE